MIGSSPIFLNFVASQVLLSRLEIQQIATNTFAGWASKLFHDKIAPNDAVFEYLVNDPIDESFRQKLYLVSHMKGDLRFISVLDRLLGFCRHLNRYLIAGSDLTFHPLGLGSLDADYIVPQDSLQTFFDETRELPLNRQRDAIISKIVAFLQKHHKENYRLRATELLELIKNPPSNIDIAQIKLWSELIKPYDDTAIAKRRENLWNEAKERYNKPEERNRFVEDRLRPLLEAKENAQQRALRAINQEIKDLVERQLETYYPKHDPQKLLRSFLYDSSLQRMVCEHIFSDEEILALEHVSANLSNWSFEDVAAITYLYICLNGNPADQYAKRYDHIVVDEAQDLSPFQFWLLRQFLTEGSMTILGDVAQSIHRYRGIGNWKELEKVFEGDSIEFAELSMTYRSTYEIVNFANTILEGSFGYTPAIPFERHGPPVAEKQVSDIGELCELILQTLEKWQGKYQNIAVIVRQENEGILLRDYLSNFGLTTKYIMSAEEKYDGGLSIILAHLTKGIEFEAVIVSNASENYYSASEIDGHLLYVVCTRPLHELSVYWIDQLSPHLSSLEPDL